MGELGKLNVKIEADTKGLTQAFSKVEKRAGSLKANLKKIGVGLAVAGVGAAVGIGVMVSKTAKAGDEIAKMAKKTGMSTEALSEWAYMAELGGTNLGAVEMGIKKMSKSLSDAKDGLSTSVRAFEKLNINIEDLKGLSPEEVFNKVTTAVAAVEDPMARAAIAQELLGKSGTDLLPILAEGAAGMAAQREEAHKLGKVWTEEGAKKAEEFNDAITRLQATFGGLAMKLADALMPVLTSLIDSFSGIVKELEPVFNVVGEMAQTLLPMFGEALGEIAKLLSPLITSLLPVFKTLFATIGAVLMPILKNVLPVLVGVFGKLIDKLAPIIDRLLPLLVKLLVPAVELIANLLDALMPLIDLGLTVLVGVLELALGILEPVIDAIALLLGWFSEGVKVIAGFISQAITPLIDAVKVVIEYVRGVVEAFAELWGWMDKFAGLGEQRLTKWPGKRAGERIEAALAETTWGLDIRKIGKIAGEATPRLGMQYGGIVPGPIGAPVPVLAHGGEAFAGVGGRFGQTVNVYVQGSVVTERELADKLREIFIDMKERNTSLGF